MAKLMTMFLILIALQACLILYATAGDIQGPCSTLGSSNGCNAGYTCMNTSVGNLQCVKYGENTSLWNFIMNTDQWNALDFFLVLGGILAGLGLAGISSGGSFRFVTDFLVLAPAVIGLISMGIVFTNFANMLRSELIAHFFTTCPAAAGAFCPPAFFIVGLIVGPLSFFYAWTVLEWVRGKDY